MTRLATVLRSAVALSLVSLPCVLSNGTARASDGDPVPGFGVDGLIDDIVLPGAVELLAKQAVVQPDGKTVVVGVLSGLPGNNIDVQQGFVVRYLPDGKRDPSFGSNGVTLLKPGLFSQPEAVAVLPSGQILVGGLMSDLMVRLNPDGSVDPTFVWSDGPVFKLVPEPDGAVIVLGDSGSNQSQVIARRLDPSGRLDVTYSGDLGTRYAATPIAALDATLSPDGRLVVAVEVLGPPTQYCVVIALGHDGRVDTGFAGGGLLPFGTANSSCRVVAEPDGDILVAEAATNAAPFQASTVTRLGPDGTVLDNAFLALPAAETPLAVEGTGRLIVVGNTSWTSTNISAYSSDGSPAIGFGGPAVNARTVPFFGYIDGVAVGPPGSLVVWASNGGNRLDVLRLSAPAGPAPQPPVLPMTRFVPLTPTRILDTRDGTGAPQGKVAALSSISVQVTGVGGVAQNGVAAIVLNVTATDTTGPGFVSVFPSGGALPLVSNLNVTGANETVANLVTVRVGSGGRVSIFTQAGAHLVADVAGYYEEAGPVSSGRFVAAVAPQRLLDTRAGLGAPPTKPGQGDTVTLQVGGNFPVPASGVAAVVLNLTATEATGDGFVTVWPTGIDRPVVSNLNVVAGETRANLVVVPLGRDGQVSIFTQRGAHLLADVTGWFTDSTAPVDTAGRFVPVTPTRVLDSRRLSTAPYPSPTTSSRTIGGGLVVPVGAAVAVALNATTVDSLVPGFVTLWPANTNQPVVSNLNVGVAGEAVPNAVIVRLEDESFAFYLQGGGHLIADVAGWFTAA